MVSYAGNTSNLAYCKIVLILVVKEEGLVLPLAVGDELNFTVLILVVMEDGLVLFKLSDVGFIRCSS